MKEKTNNAGETIQSVIADIESVMERLFISGIAAADADVAAEVKRLHRESEQYGLSLAADLLGRLAGALESKRHNLEGPVTEITDIYCRLGLYIQEVKHQLALTAIFS